MFAVVLLSATRATAREDSDTIRRKLELKTKGQLKKILSAADVEFTKEDEKDKATLVDLVMDSDALTAWEASQPVKKTADGRVRHDTDVDETDGVQPTSGAEGRWWNVQDREQLAKNYAVVMSMMFDELDTDGDKALNAEEFRNATGLRSDVKIDGKLFEPWHTASAGEASEDAFARHDADASGDLTGPECQPIMLKMVEAMAQAEANYFMNGGEGMGLAGGGDDDGDASAATEGMAEGEAADDDALPLQDEL